MDGAGPSPQLATAAAPTTRSYHTRPSTSAADLPRGSSSERRASFSVPHGPPLSVSGDHNTLTSSITISSDTAYSSLEASSSVPTTHATGPTAATTGGEGVSRPLWCGALSALLAEDPTRRAPTSKAALTSSSLVPQEWRCSIDFSHAVDARAETELLQLWTALWSATHSEAALETALNGPQQAYNPYRPARGGHEVREEVLNSEVAEFRATIPTDSLYLRGSAVAMPDLRVGKAAAAAEIATTSPHRPPHRSTRTSTSEPRCEEGGEGEEVFALDDSGVEARPAVPRHPPLPTKAPTAAALPSAATTAAAVENAPLPSAERVEAEETLFRYLWEAVVVPFYTEDPAASFPAAFPTMGLRTGVTTSTSLTLPPAGEDRDASGVVTAFWPPREEKRNWTIASYPASSTSPNSTHESRGAFEGDVLTGTTATVTLVRPGSPLTRTQRTGVPVARYPTDDVHVLSDDSLEVEVLDESTALLRPVEMHTPVKRRKEGSLQGISLGGQSARRTSRWQERPSTAGVQASVFPSSAGIALETPTSVAPHGAVAATKQRARSARSNEAGVTTTGAAAGGGKYDAERKARTASPPLPTAAGAARVLRWANTPTLQTNVNDALEEALLEAPLPKPVSAARQRPPTAQPVVSRRKRAGSPSGGAQQQRQAGHSAASSRSPSGAGEKPQNDNSSTNGTGGTRVVASAAAMRTAPSSLGRQPDGFGGGDGGGGSRAQRPPRQLNAGANGAASRALQLLEMRSRATSRSPYGQRLPSPAPTAAGSSGAGGGATVTSVTPAAEVPRKRRSHRGAVLCESGEVLKGVESGRHGQLSPMRATPGPTQQRQRHNHAGRPTASANVVTFGGRLSAAGQVEEDVQAPQQTLAGSAEERLVPLPRRAPLRGVSATTATQPTTSPVRHPTPEVVRGLSAVGRAPSLKTRRQGKTGGQRSTAREEKAVLQRPTTAQQ